MVGAPTGSASFNGGGITVHRLFGVLTGRTEDNISQDALRTLKKTFKDAILLVFDERSMISAELLGKVEKIVQKVVHNGLHDNTFFGSIPIILLVEDDYQLPPVGIGAAGKFSGNLPKGSAAMIGYVNHRHEAFKILGENYIKLKTLKRV